MKIHVPLGLMVNKLDSKVCLNALHVILDISVLEEGLLQMGSAVQVGIVHMELIHLCLVVLTILMVLMLLLAAEAYVILDFTALLVVKSLYLVPKACFVMNVASLSLLVHV